MSYYMVSYDLSNPGRNYDDLHKFLRSQADWAKPLESLWIVESNLTALEFVNAALEHVDRNDHILVTPFSGSAAWYNLDPKVADWLNRTRV
jgi:hypothetical protein